MGLSGEVSQTIGIDSSNQANDQAANISDDPFPFAGQGLINRGSSLISPSSTKASSPQQTTSERERDKLEILKKTLLLLSTSVLMH